MLALEGVKFRFGGRETLAGPCDACQPRSFIASDANSSLSVALSQLKRIAELVSYQMSRMMRGHEVMTMRIRASKSPPIASSRIPVGRDRAMFRTAGK